MPEVPVPKIKLSDLVRLSFGERPLFDKLRVQPLNKRGLVRDLGAFEKLALFYVEHAGRDYHPHMAEAQIVAILRARLDNTKDGSPAFEVSLNGKRAGLAFMLQYSRTGEQMSWQQLTSDGLFKNDDPLRGEILACPQLIVSPEHQFFALPDGKQVVRMAVYLKLMDEMAQYAQEKMPKPAKKFEVWVPADDKAQNAFHLRAYARLDCIEFQNGLIPAYHDGPMMKVWDYTHMVRLLKEDVKLPDPNGP